MTSVEIKPVFAIYFTFAFSSWKLSLWIFRRIEMLVYSISPPSLSLISAITTKRSIVRQNKTGNTHKHTHRQIKTDTLPIGYKVKLKKKVQLKSISRSCNSIAIWMAVLFQWPKEMNNVALLDFGVGAIGRLTPCLSFTSCLKDTEQKPSKRKNNTGQDV